MPNQRLIFVPLVTLIAAIAASPTPAQPESDPVSIHAAAPVLDWSHAQQAHGVIQRWVTAGTVDTKATAQRIRVTGATGAQVTLRWSGLTMGWGQATVLDLNPADPSDRSIDLIDLVRIATRRALATVAQKLRDHRLHQAATGEQPPGHSQSLADAGPHLQVDLQIARAFQRIHLSSRHAWPKALSRQFVSGQHGLRMTAGHGHHTEKPKTAWIWPANAMAANLSPQRQLTRLLADLGYDHTQMKRVGQKDGPHLERFDVIHMVRPRPDLPAQRLVRGNKAAAPANLSERSLEEMARQFTKFLLRRQRPAAPMAGTYHPSNDRYDPVTASIQDWALAAYAIGRRAALLKHIDKHHPQLPGVLNATHTAASQLAHLRPNDTGAGSIIDPAATALILMTLTESPNLDPYKKDRDVLAQWLLDQRNPDGSFGPPTNSTSPPFGKPTQALIATALSSYYRQIRDEPLGQKLMQSQDWLWQESDPNTQLKMLPWLVVTEFRMHQLGVTGPTPDRWQRVTSAIAPLINAMRQKHTKGFSHPADPTGGLPEPHWHAAHLMMVLAAALEQHDPTQRANTIGWLLDCDVAGRTLARLKFDPASCYYVRSPSDALGGVRQTMWDNRLGVAPTATALLAVTYLQQVLSQIDPADVLGGPSKSASP